MSDENTLPGPDTADLSGLEGILGGKDKVRVLRYPHETEPDEEGKTTEWHCDIVVVDTDQEDTAVAVRQTRNCLGQILVAGV